jgi:protein-S-isoprenylcysteine O-methyltransferase Ste14
MTNDQTFHRILVLVSLVIFPITLFHRIRSQATGESLDRWQEGAFILFTLRGIGAATMLGFTAYLVNPAWMAWSSTPLPVWLRWTGIGLDVLAGLLLVWTLRCLGKNLTDTVVTRREHTLVTRGPYRWVRHPFYDAVALLLTANALAAANWFLFVGGAIALALIVLRTRREEDRLVARFGDSYRDYMNRTGRFLPKLG